MVRTFSLAALCVAFALTASGCASPPPDFVPAPEVPAADACIPRDATGDTGYNYGIPRPGLSLPGTGIVDVTVIAVDFPDAPGEMPPSKAIDRAMPDLPGVLMDLSYGNSSVRVSHNLEWVRLSGNVGSYRFGDAQGMVELAQEAIELSDAELDFSSTEVVLILPPPNAETDVAAAHLNVDSRTGTISADGRNLTSLITVGHQTYDRARMLVVAELGHAFGLPALYDADGGGLLYTGHFGLMGADFGLAPEFFAFERWVLGWIDDSQVACLIGDGGVRLTAVEVEGGTKAAIIPIAPNQLLVVESRRARGYDSGLAEAGALVYLVDLSLRGGAGPILIYPKMPASRESAPLSVGESVTFEGITITEVWAGDTDDIVQITFK